MKTLSYDVISYVRYIPMRYIQSMGTFGFANQLYKSGLRFYYSASKEVSESVPSGTNRLELGCG